MLQVFIIVCAVITFIVMAADPRHTQQDQAVSAWQKTTQTAKNTSKDQTHLNLTQTDREEG